MADDGMRVQVTAVDTNGAGDTFATAYMLALASGSNQPGTLANWAAAQAVSQSQVRLPAESVCLSPGLASPQPSNCYGASLPSLATSVGLRRVATRCMSCISHDPHAFTPAGMQAEVRWDGHQGSAWGNRHDCR